MTNNITTYGNMTLRPYQAEAVENIKDHIRKQLRGEIESSPAYFEGYVGCGKTLIIGALAVHCERVGARFLVLARTGELVEQNSDEIVNMGGHCSVYSASLNTKSTHFSTVVGTEGTVANALDDDFSQWIPHVILLDEAHQAPWDDILNYGNSQYARIINHFKKLNQKVAIIGLTGSPYRGTESIKGPFWKEVLQPVVGREFLVDNGFLVPTIFGFGHDETQYDLNGFDAENEKGTSDFSDAKLAEMHSRMKLSQTQAIMQEVIALTKDRLCVLITCAGKKHCEEAASCLPADEYAIITDSTPARERQDILRSVKRGDRNDRGTFRYKYVLQVNALSVGVNVVLWDTSVILRRIGSLTLLTQLLGRGMRLLNQQAIDQGYTKENHLVLDYSETMSNMAEMFHDPILEEAMRSKDKDEGRPKTCPDCGADVGEHARKCCFCGYWFRYRECEDTTEGGIVTEKGCGAKNDIAARVCSNCGKYLINPNDKLSKKHYSNADWKPVLDWKMEIIGKNSDAIKVSYYLDNYGLDGTQEVAEVCYWAIFSGGKHIWKGKFVSKHVVNGLWNKAVNCKNIAELIKPTFWKVPAFITHRKNAKGESVVNGITFKGETVYKAKK